MQENYIKIPPIQACPARAEQLELREFVVEGQNYTPDGIELTVKRCIDVAICPQQVDK